MCPGVRYRLLYRRLGGVGNATTRLRELLQYVNSVAIVCDRLWGVGSAPHQTGLDARPAEVHVFAATPQPRGNSVAFMPTAPSPWRRHLSRPSDSVSGYGSLGLSVTRVWKDARPHPITMYSGSVSSAYVALPLPSASKQPSTMRSFAT